MILPNHLTDVGFSLSDIVETDFEIFFTISRECYEPYVDEYFGGWEEDFQINMNRDSFNNMRKATVSRKILLHGEPVGFFSINEKDDRIRGISIFMTAKARGRGIGSFYMAQVTAYAERTHKPATLRVFKTNPARKLYERHSFKTYDEIRTHYLMRYEPKNTKERT